MTSSTFDVAVCCAQRPPPDQACAPEPRRNSRPRIFDGDHRLVGEGFNNGQLVFTNGSTRVRLTGDDAPTGLSLADKGHALETVRTSKGLSCAGDPDYSGSSFRPRTLNEAAEFRKERATIIPDSRSTGTLNLQRLLRLESVVGQPGTPITLFSPVKQRDCVAQRGGGLTSAASTAAD